MLKLKIILIILSAAVLIFYGGVYVGQKINPIENSLKGTMISPIQGFGVIKAIDKSAITVISGSKTFKLAVNQATKFNLAAKTPSGEIKITPIQSEGLKINGKVYFWAKVNGEGSLIIISMNLKEE